MQELRRRIDEIDDKIVELFSERMEISKEVAREKKKIKKAITDTSREENIVKRLQAKSPEYSSYIKRLYQTIFSMSKSLQRLSIEESEFEKKLIKSTENLSPIIPKSGRIAVQGTRGSYGDLTAERIFPEGDKIYYDTFEKIFEAVNDDSCEFGILPIENSTYGSVNEVYDLMAEKNCYIVGEYKLEIQHNLLAKAGTRFEDIKEVVSHYQALGQCRDFFKKNPHIKASQFKNTALSAQFVKESDRKDIACISSKSCSKIFDLEILDDNIQNNKNNYTRFIVISKDMRVYPGANKITIILEAEHKPGSLFDLIGKFSAIGLNLTKIESRPIPGSDFEFMFYFDFEGSILNIEVRKLLNELNERKEYFSFLGNYVEY